MPYDFSLFTSSIYPMYSYFTKQIFEDVVYTNPYFILRQTHVPLLYHLSSENTVLQMSLPWQKPLMYVHKSQSFLT